MHSKFTDIGQFRNAIGSITRTYRFAGLDENGDAILDPMAIPPVITFTGTVKLHGSNAGVAMDKDDLIWYQSKTNVITPEKDNAGFAFFADTRKDIFKSYIDEIKIDNDITDETVIIYGEWCGGSIQKGVAINGLDKMFVIFAIKVDNEWLSHDKLINVKSNDEKIYNILQYPVYDFEINFNNPKEAAERIASVVDQVEQECPVGRAFGNEGIGEGIVLTCLNEGYSGSKFWFKVKGEKHAKSGKKDGKVKVAVDIERVNTIKALVETIVPESRLVQGLDYLRQNDLELSKKSTGSYLKWLYEDTIKEELDTITGNGFEPKDVSTEIQKYAKDWFFQKTDELVGL